MAIDPGTTESAYVVLDGALKPFAHGIVANEDMAAIIQRWSGSDFAIEMIASYGMAVGAETFETVFWIGRFWQMALDAGYANLAKIGRIEVKSNLCHTVKAKDANVRQALVDRFGDVGTKKEPGFFYGVKSHIWSAIAVGVTYADRLPFDEIQEVSD